MRKFLFLLLLASTQRTQAQQSDFCSKLEQLLVSVKNEDRNLWGEFLQGDSFTQSYQSKFSLGEGNSKNALFYIVGDGKGSIGYREELYGGVDSVAGWKMYKSFQSRMQKCVNFKLEEKETDYCKCKTVIFYYADYNVELEFSAQGFGHNITVVFRIRKTNP